jgi:RHH-type rel operon transcriptional repressor/antitoxin RelB
MSNPLSIELKISQELSDAVDELSATSGKTAELIAEEALQHYVDWRHEQQLDLDAAILAADRGEFASDDEVKAFFARHGT